VVVLTPDKAGPKERPTTHEVRWFEWSGASKPLVDFSLRSPADLRAVFSLLGAGRRALEDLIAERRIDHCLALWAVPSGYLAWRACRPAVPYSVWALGSDIHTWARRPVIGTLVRRVLRDADRRFADGLALSADVRRISGRDCEFLPTTRQLPEPAQILKPAHEGLTFLFVGRLEAVKGADLLVEAMARVLARGINARLILCGTGSLEDALRLRVEQARASEEIEFLGSQPGAVISAYMSACDCLVIPSRMESIPIVFSEALQAGIPVLMTDVGDLGELARRHDLTAPVPPGDAEALARALEAFALDPDGQRALYRRARQELLATFDLQATADRFLAAIGGS
jgi:glycosyltransferase involved in cell wall biosynthesis